MVTISSDSRHIEQAFSKLIETLEEAGSGFHSNLCIDASTQAITVSTKEPMPNGKEIIRIPRAALMPGDQYVVKLSGDYLEVDYFANSTLKDRQKAIISQMFEIYNLTGKISEHKKLCFLLSLKEYPSLYEKLMKDRHYNPKYDTWFEGLQKGMPDHDYKRFIIDTFIQTRPLGYSDPIREDSMSTIMPVIDFLNHHWDGATFSVAGGARVGDLTVATSQPIEGSTECFASYGVLDSADALIRYNFVDQSTQVVRSIAMELDLPDGRKILIDNKHHEPRTTPLPQELSDLSYYAPPFAFAEEEGREEAEQNLHVAYLIIPALESGAPLALRRVLGYIIRHVYAKFGKDINFNLADWIAEAEQKVLTVNLEHYKEVQDHTEELIREKGPSDGLSRIKLLTELQLDKLERYQLFSQRQKLKAS